MIDALSQIDLAFCVDLTNSMTGFIKAAQAHMLNVLNALTDAAGADLRVGLVGYRDYGTKTKLLELYPFRAEPTETRDVLKGLRVSSPPENTDAAEAVFAGLAACLGDLTWRPGAVKVLLLVGDAPPHACGATAPPCPDRFPNGDPSGKTLMGTSAAIESAGITLHALGMVPSILPVYDPVLERAFGYLASTTAGTYRPARSSADAMAVVEIIGKRVFGQMEFDRKVWGQVTTAEGEGLPEANRLAAMMPELQQKLAATPYQIHAAVERLRRRNLPH